MGTEHDTTDKPAARRPGGRSARVQQSVYRAVGHLVARGHRDTMTIPQVAEEADVNPTSIYRRCGSITHLLEEVAVAALTQGEDLPDTGALGTDLAEWARIIAADVAQTSRREYLRALVFARDAVIDACPCWETRREQATSMIARAAGRDETVPTVEQILDHIIAPIYHHAVFGLPLDDAYATRLAEETMRLAGA